MSQVCQVAQVLFLVEQVQLQLEQIVVVRSLGQVFIDSSIKRTANINLYKLDQRFKQSRINIESFHSTVLLTGQVPDLT